MKLLGINSVGLGATDQLLSDILHSSDPGEEMGVQ
jgi:hypothetical protein